MTKLLVSVRSAEEATAALTSGADIIDVKEPVRGSLGRADDRVIREVMEVVGGRVAVSAALGELVDDPKPPPAGLAFVKVGLAGLGDDWRNRWKAWSSSCNAAVLVAYADVHEIDDLLSFANETRPAVFLIDTSHKDGKTLFDHLTIEKLSLVRQRCAVPLAVAGSLGLENVDSLLPLKPDIIAVRGAVCRGGRDGTVDVELVRQLASRLARVGGAG